MLSQRRGVGGREGRLPARGRGHLGTKGERGGGSWEGKGAGLRSPGSRRKEKVRRGAAGMLRRSKGCREREDAVGETLHPNFLPLNETDACSRILAEMRRCKHPIKDRQPTPPKALYSLRKNSSYLAHSSPLPADGVEPQPVVPGEVGVPESRSNEVPLPGEAGLRSLTGKETGE